MYILFTFLIQYISWIYCNPLHKTELHDKGGTNDPNYPKSCFLTQYRQQTWQRPMYTTYQLHFGFKPKIWYHGTISTELLFHRPFIPLNANEISLRPHIQPSLDPAVLEYIHVYRYIALPLYHGLLYYV